MMATSKEYLFFCCLILYLSTCQASNLDTYLILDVKEHPYSWIVYLQETSSGKHWILKQIKEKAPEEQIQLLMEVLVANMAKEFNIPINSVHFILPGELNDIKPLPFFPATLHSQAPGQVVEELREWEDLEIGQRIRAPNTPQFDKYGPLNPSRTGLTWTVITSMSRHIQLPLIVALDTFVGNNDRWCNNLFYDKETDTFTGIDLGESYKYNLCLEAKKRLDEYHHHCTQLTASKEILEALRIYQKTLDRLKQKWPPKKIANQFKNLCKLSELDHAENTKFIHKQKKYLDAIEENGAELCPLLEALDEFLESGSKANPTHPIPFP